jgi:hypothetical protein
MSCEEASPGDLAIVDTFKTELIRDRVWRTRGQMELAVLEWVHWFNHDRLHESLGDVPPVEDEDAYRIQLPNDSFGVVADRRFRASRLRTTKTYSPSLRQTRPVSPRQGGKQWRGDVPPQGARPHARSVGDIVGDRQAGPADRVEVAAGARPAAGRLGQ